MFEYIDPNGNALPENEVIKLAKESFTDINAYIKKNKLSIRPTKKTKTDVVVKKEQAKPVEKTTEELWGKQPEVDILGVKKMENAKPAKFDAKQFANDLGSSKGEGFYTKGEKNIEKSGIKIKQLEDSSVQDIYDNFSNLSYDNLSPDEKNNIDDKSVELLSKKYKVSEDYTLSTNDIELKSKELLAKASGKKKAIEDETYVERILDGTAAGLNYMGEMFASMPETIYRVAAAPQNLVSFITGDKSLEASPEKLKGTTGVSNSVMDHFISERNRIGKKNEIYDNANYDSTSITENISNRNYIDAFKLLGSGLAESAPISIGLMMGGAEAGIAKTALEGAALFAGPAVREQKEKKLDESELSSVLKGFGIAGAESVFGAIGQGSLGKVYKDIIKKEGVDVGSKIFKDGLVVAYQTALKRYGAPAAMLGEGLEEVATTVTQNLINDKPAFDGTSDSFIAGVGGGATWGAPVNIIKGVQGFKDGVTAHKINTVLKEEPANTIKEAFSPKTPITKAQLNISLIPNSYKILNSQIDIAQNAGEMTKEEGDEIKKEFAGTYHVANTLKELKLDENSNVEIANLMKERGALVTKIKAVNDPTLTTIQSARVKELNVEIEGVIKTHANTEIEKSIAQSEKIISETGEKVYEKPLGSGKSFEVFETATEAQSAYDKWAKENNKESEDIKGTDGFKLPNGQMLINKERAIEVRALNVAPHELLHNVVDFEFSNPAEGEKLKNAFLDVLSSTEKEKLDKRLEAYTPEQLKESPGEYITQYFELIKSKDITWSDNLKESLIRVWKNVLKPIIQKAGWENIEFEDGRDIYNFVKDYSKSIEKGELTARSKKLLKKGEGYTGVTSFSKSSDLKVELEKLLKKEDEFDDPQEFDDLVTNLEYKIKAAVKSEENNPATEVKKPKVAVTEEGEIEEIIKNEKGSIASDKVQKIYDERGESGADEIIKLFKPITAKIVDKRRDAPGFNKEDLTSEIENGAGGLFDLIRKYDASKGVPLAAYINKNLPLRAITASRRVLDQQFNKDASEEVSLIATETADQNMTERVAEKPKYKNALESKVLPAEALETAAKKILPIVRTLKSRIDAPVTLNRTVTPLIAEIRDEVGKQLDIDIKTMLGGKKDGVLRKELLRTKRYVLENMTTTWLMGKDGQGGIPQAIQKQIDGKWVNFPIWVGQKIDREAMSTDLAGRTSGTELARRLPNVFNNVSDAEFLAQIIGPDGNPIRGRKESISKAMAEEIAFDIINDDIAGEGVISDALKANQERQGAVIADNFATDVLRQSERGNIKLSLTAKVSKEVSNAMNEYYEVVQQWNADEKKTAWDYQVSGKRDNTEAGKSIQRVVDVYRAAIRFAFFKINKTKLIGSPTQIAGSIGHEDRLSDLIKSNAKLSNNELADKIQDFLKAELKDYKTSPGNFITTNSQYFAHILKPMLLNNGKSDLLGKNGFELNIVDVTKTEEKGKKIPVGKQFTNIKSFILYKSKPLLKYTATTLIKVELAKGGDVAANVEKLIAKDADHAIDYTLTHLKELKASGKKLDGHTFIALLGSDTSGLIRKLSRLGMYTVGLKAKDGRLEHNPPINAIKAKLIEYLTTGSIDIKEIEDYLKNVAKVNFIPLVADNMLTAIGAKTEAYDKEGVLRTENLAYIKTLIPFKDQLRNIDKAYGSLKNFDNLVKAAEAIDVAENMKQDNIRTAVVLSRSLTPKGISVFDFDDTVGLTNGNVLYTMPDGSKGKLNAEEFAKEGSRFLEEGAAFDFSEFSKVVGGKPGPMVEKMKKMIGKFGPENFFILTARPANAAGPIHEFLSSIGIDIPLENITGLGNSTAQAKADWMVEKASAGYNDFYFSDDAIQNVAAVKNALDVLDVKSKIQQARLKFSKTISIDFNKILEENVGVKATEKISAIAAKRKGAAIGKYRFFVPPSAADLELLTYDFLGSGKTGEQQQEFFNKALFEPYSNGIALIDAAKQSIKNDYKALLKAFPVVSKELGKLTPDKAFTYDQALRVAMWNSMGEEIPGLLKAEITKLSDFVNQDPELSAFKAGLIATGRQGSGWTKPSEYWDSETIVSDLHNITEKLGRKKYLAEFVQNSEEMFSKDNLNKIETIYGSNFRDALEDSIYSMTNGTNREAGAGRINAGWLNWINNSTGAIMFLNTRSAILQTIGAINYLNWRDNNPLNAGIAFANQPQYWKDFAYIWNSDKMKERRSGLKEDVSSAEIANAASGSTSKANAVISYLLKKGFMPTQIGDSFAIASGGAAFYRNRVNYNLKQGMSQSEAELEAWKDFIKVTDQTQQSGDPRDISQQQRSASGRLVLAFQNTSMQQARLVKKAGLDLINGRGDAKTNISKIVYYTAVQNIIFGSLQSALFVTMFGDDDDEDDAKKKKNKTMEERYIDIGNGIVDTILRGSGMAGAIVATLKNTYLKYHTEQEKGFKADYAKVLTEAVNIAPPVGSKLVKLMGSMKTAAFEKDVIAKRGWSVMQDGRVNLSPLYSVAGQTVEAVTNLPMNRFVTKVKNLSEVMDSRNKSWQRIAMLIGYNPYSVGAKDEEGDIIKAEAKAVRKEQGIINAEETRRIKKEEFDKLPWEERQVIKAEKRKTAREKRANKRNIYK